MPADPLQPAPPVEVAEAPATAEPYPASPAAEQKAAAAPPGPQDGPPREDHSAGVRALQEAFALDVAEREDRHRAEVRAMQQSFMTDVGAREERHRAEVQVLHQRLAAEIAERDDRHRTEVAALQQTLEATRTQLGDVTSVRDRETQARAASEVEVERLRVELDTQTKEIARLNAKVSDLASSLAATRQQADQWNDRARRLEAELTTARADAEQAAADHATRYGEKSRVLEDTERQLEETARKLAVAEERGNRLADQSAAHDAAAQQLRTTVAEQRAERERITAERDTARAQAADFEGQLRRVEFEAEQADEEATRHLNDAMRKIEVLEEHNARVSGHVTVHEATIEELRKAAADQHIEMKKVEVDRDAARRRVAALEAEVARLERDGVLGAAAAAAEESDDVTRAIDETSVPADLEVAVDGAAAVGDRPLSLSEDVELVAWQQEALAAWARHGHRGVVEAITGAGKTPLAFWAIGAALDAGMKVLVIAPNEARVEHWYDGLRGALPINRVAKRTGAKDEHLGAADVAVVTAPDAAQESIFGATSDVLLVADQVHSYGTRDDSRALDPVYAWRLGLTALYERDDNGVSTYLDPYFGGVSFRLGYERALADGVVAPFDVAAVSVALTSAEQAEYDALGQQAATLAEELVTEFGVPAEPPHEFATAVVALADGRMGPPRTAARAYQKALAKQSDVVVTASAKATVLKTLAEAIRNEPALIFAETPQDATHIAKVLGSAGITTRPVGGGQERRLLGRRNEEVRDDDIVLVAGSGDASHVDLGVVVGASASTLQSIQRLGQVIRKKDDERRARLVTIEVEGTARVAVGNSLTSVTAPVATQESFGSTDAVTLLEFLAGADAAAEPEPDEG